MYPVWCEVLQVAFSSSTEGTRDIETTIFDPASEFLNFLYLVYLLYCCFTSKLAKSRLQFLSASFYVPSVQCPAKRQNTHTHTHTHIRGGGKRKVGELSSTYILTPHYALLFCFFGVHRPADLRDGKLPWGEIAPCREVRAKETCARIEGGGGGDGHAANPEPHAHAQPHTNTHTQSTRTCTPLHKHRHHRYSQLAHFPYNNSGCKSMCSARA